MTIKWTTPLCIPTVYGEDIDFEIYDKHEFGYNPEEMQTLLYGTIRLSENQKIGKFSVYSSGEDHKKVGSLIMDIKKNKVTNAKEGSSTLSSILGTFLFTKFARPRNYLGKATLSSRFKGRKQFGPSHLNLFQVSTCSSISMKSETLTQKIFLSSNSTLPKMILFEGGDRQEFPLASIQTALKF